MNVTVVCRAFCTLAVSALFVSNALAYDELVDGDISGSSGNPTVIPVPPEGLTIKGTQSNFFDGIEGVIDFGEGFPGVFDEFAGIASDVFGIGFDRVQSAGAHPDDVVASFVVGSCFLVGWGDIDKLVTKQSGGSYLEG